MKNEQKKKLKTKSLEKKLKKKTKTFGKKTPFEKKNAL